MLFKTIPLSKHDVLKLKFLRLQTAQNQVNSPQPPVGLREQRSPFLWTFCLPEVAAVARLGLGLGIH